MVTRMSVDGLYNDATLLFSDITWHFPTYMSVYVVDKKTVSCIDPRCH